jgi:hypothetical protein
MFVWSETYGNASYYSMKNDLSLFRVPCELADSMTLPMINILSFLEYHHILAHGSYTQQQLHQSWTMRHQSGILQYPTKRYQYYIEPRELQHKPS